MAGDIYYNSVSLLLHGNGSDGGVVFTDNAPTPKTNSVTGNTNTSTAQNKYGSASILFDGTGDSLSITSGSTDFTFGTGAFTLEFWIRPIAIPASDATILDCRYGVTSNNPQIFLSSTGVLIYLSSGITLITGTAVLAINTWYHVAVCRSGTSTKMFVNGTQDGSTASDSTNYSVGNSSKPISFNYDGFNATASIFNGYLDDIRVTKGIARYTSAFTSPTSEFSDVLTFAYSNVGSITVSVIPNSPMHKRLHFGLLGNITIPITPFSILLVKRNMSISDTFNMSFNITSELLLKLLDQIVINLTTITYFTLKETIVDFFNILDSFLLSYRGTISESIILSSTLSGIIYQIEKLISGINTLDSINTKYIIISRILDLINILDFINWRYIGIISDTFSITSIISSLYETLNKIVESIVLDGSFSEKHIYILSLSDFINLVPTFTSKSIFKNGLLDKFIINIPTAKGSDKYLAYLLSPETNSVSNYDNYNFDGCTKFDNKYLFYNSTGLYEYGGNLDNNAIIRSRIETIAYNFGSSNLKQIPSVYLGINTSGTTFLKVRVDGKADVTYKLNKKTNGLQTQKIEIGKGLIGRYFQFEIITDSSNFNMESIEFFPIELKRKL